MKTGLVLEGGAYRGIFTTGVLKVLKKHNIDFQYIVGVSAGAGNIVDFVSGRDDVARNFVAVSKKNSSYGLSQLLKSGYILNVDAMAKDLMTMDNNDVAESIMNSPIDMEIVCTNCITAKPEYMFERKSIRKLIEIGKASCSVPVICKPVMLDGIPYVDGSVTDPFPLRRALDVKGCDKAVVILTRREGETPTNYTKAAIPIRFLYHDKYPVLEKVLLKRLDSYERDMEYLYKMEREGKAFIVRPSIKSIDRFESDVTKLRNYYIHGIDTMERRMGEFMKFLNG